MKLYLFPYPVIYFLDTNRVSNYIKISMNLQ